MPLCGLRHSLGNYALTIVGEWRPRLQCVMKENSLYKTLYECVPVLVLPSLTGLQTLRPPAVKQARDVFKTNPPGEMMVRPAKSWKLGDPGLILPHFCLCFPVSHAESCTEPQPTWPPSSYPVQLSEVTFSQKVWALSSMSFFKSIPSSHIPRYHHGPITTLENMSGWERKK